MTALVIMVTDMVVATGLVMGREYSRGGACGAAAPDVRRRQLAVIDREACRRRERCR